MEVQTVVMVEVVDPMLEAMEVLNLDDQVQFLVF